MISLNQIGVKKLVGYLISTVIIVGFLFSFFYNPASEPINDIQVSRAAAAWADSNWEYRKYITIDHTQVAGSSYHSNFPIMISVTDPDLRDIANGGHVASSTGDDIMFTVGGGSTQLSHEIEHYDNTTGELLAWVNMLAVDNDEDTYLYMYYGNDAAADQQDVSGTWDPRYIGVWHMNQDPSGVAPQILDSTANARHGTSGGTMTSGDLVTGIFGGAAIELDGTDDYINIYNAALQTDFDGDAGTYSLWFKMTDAADWTDTIQEHIIAIAADANNRIRLRKDNHAEGRWGYQHHASGTNISPEINNSADTTDWYYVTMTWDTVADELKLYENGVQLLPTSTGLGTWGATPGAWSYTLQSVIGGEGTTFGEYIGASVDEVRIVAGEAKSADWIATEYSNQSDPDSFMTFGNEEIEPVCGNDSLDYGEACDDGNTSNEDQCSSDCLNSCVSPEKWNGTTCYASATGGEEDTGTCGNGIIDGIEVCDDYNTLNYDTCSYNCRMTCDGGYYWNGSECKKFAATVQTICGSLDSNFDGYINISDLSAFAKKYSKTCLDSPSSATYSCGRLDNNGDKKLNIVDFAAFAASYDPTNECN
ncbi:DUF2341 domain-containing protein [Candidatus Dojkabacteria bacterium]|uniref:DUF2341 domain-containing protein n=1 Tax=Candidatus Dojkabacteria bacterium TaxID=2099670 RepID=A0A955RLD6_9BACT|nr:DUF2341 domain-containing protein [Candidatus Dojkabacteria bacterium]